MADPHTLVVVTGTGTEVGKTWVATGVLSALVAAGVTCSARKPAQSFDPGDPTTDARELASATGEDPAVVCPRHRNYEVPMAPPMAADVLRRPRIEIDALATEVRGSWASPAPELGLVELAGGVRSPLAHDGDGVDMITALEPSDVLLVADAGLGTINAVLSSLDSLAAVTGDNAARIVVHLNRYDDSSDLHRRNRQWLGVAGVQELTTEVGRLADLLRGRVS